MTKYLTVAETAKLVRRALKEAFPGQKFSVRSHSYAGGASIQVSYVDGPRERDVEQVARQFAGATFDGMTDMRSYHASEYEGETVHFGADFVFTDRDVSPAVLAAARVRAEKVWNEQVSVPPTDNSYVDGWDPETGNRLAGGISQWARQIAEYIDPEVLRAEYQVATV